MDERAAKLALARKKLKDHQEKKLFSGKREDNNHKSENVTIKDNENSMHITLNHDEAFSHDTMETQYNDDSETIRTGFTTSAAINQNHFKNEDYVKEAGVADMDVNITEILISNKRNLELQLNNLQMKFNQLEHQHALVISDYKICNQKINELESELKNINNEYLNATQEIMRQNSKINELESSKLLLSEEINNLTEQLEFTKTVLNAKEAESDSLHNQIFDLQNQYDTLNLQLQQLTNGSSHNPSGQFTKSDNNEVMLQKISNLEQQLSILQKERDQINLHYEHYVAELNEQLRSVIKKNEELTRDVENLSNRENSLIEQISDMEIRIQNYNLGGKNSEIDHNTDFIKDLQDELKKAQDELKEMRSKYEGLQKQYAESVAKVEELSEIKAVECSHDDISLSKLNADMASDKVAAQRATEQNKKLKQDLQGLEDAFVKMSKDKLELTEKISAEKFLNRELTIKLSEIEEKAKDMQIKLKAKDEEMLRLQSNYREIEKRNDEIMKLQTVENVMVPAQVIDTKSEIINSTVVNAEKDMGTTCRQLTEEVDDKTGLQSADAMRKLQDRFLKIMGEVAELSDEKHRLEHIILQLQNETDTICEYVALYQQQRSLLKRRDEERSAQLKVFQQECEKLKSGLEELSQLLARFAEDKELSLYFETESKKIDMENVMKLLSNLRNNSLIDTNKKNIEFRNFYPCNCCSGQLIEV